MLRNAGHHENVEFEITFAEPYCINDRLSAGVDSVGGSIILDPKSNVSMNVSLISSGESVNTQTGLLFPADRKVSKSFL